MWLHLCGLLRESLMAVGCGAILSRSHGDVLSISVAPTSSTFLTKAARGLFRVKLGTALVTTMSAFPSRATKLRTSREVRFVPTTVIETD